jgi:small-conductance mechanosensitive channel
MKLIKNKSYLVIMLSLMLILMSACSSGSPGQDSDQTSSPTPSVSLTQRLNALTVTAAARDDDLEATPTPLLGELINDRTPQPTATLGPVMQAIEQYAARQGLLSTKFLGLRLVDWINLIISILTALAGYLLGTWLIKKVFPSLVKRTGTQIDDELLENIGAQVRWLVTIVVLRFAVTDRLAFIGERLNQVLRDIFFITILSLIVWIIWKAIDFSGEKYADKQAKTGREEIEPVIKMVSKFIQILTGIAGFAILLSYFGINVSTLTAALGIGGLALSLAAKDTVSDAIAGVILLVDQPFRVGDRIEIQGVGTWGDVTEIGLRTTRIRTRDNRMVIVPNSIIGNNQVVNYSFPDPRYRIQTHIYVPVDADIEEIRQLLIQAVREVDGVIADKPVDALFIDMTEGPIKFRMRWWIESYVDTRRMLDWVHTAIKQSLDEAGIKSPKVVDDINLTIDPLTTERISRAFRSQPSADTHPSTSWMDSDQDQNLDS